MTYLFGQSLLYDSSSPLALSCRSWETVYLARLLPEVLFPEPCFLFCLPESSGWNELCKICKNSITVLSLKEVFEGSRPGFFRIPDWSRVKKYELNSSLKDVLQAKLGLMSDTFALQDWPIWASPFTSTSCSHRGSEECSVCALHCFSELPCWTSSQICVFILEFSFVKSFSKLLQIKIAWISSKVKFNEPWNLHS